MLERGRQNQRLAEVRGILVRGEARLCRCELEQHAARLAEVDGLEPETVDQLGRPGAGLQDALPDLQLVLLVPRAPGDMVDRSGAGDSGRGGGRVEHVAAAAALAARLPRALARGGETEGALEERTAALRVGGVGTHLLEALDRELLRDLRVLGGERLVGRLDDAELEPEAFRILEGERALRRL